MLPIVIKISPVVEMLKHKETNIFELMDMVVLLINGGQLLTEKD